MAHSPIVIAGTSRSGTTLTSEILDRHSQIFVVRGRIGFLKGIYADRTKIGSLPTEAAAQEAVLARVRTFYSLASNASEQANVVDLFCNTDTVAKLLSAHSRREMATMFFEARAMWAGKSRWARHWPGSLHDLPSLLSSDPDVKVIFCVRNPLDYLVSYRDSFKRAERRNRLHRVESLRRLYHPVITSLLWVATMRIARKALARYGDRLIISRYEDLVTDPERSVRRICAFVGSDFESAMLDIDNNNSSENVAERGIFASSVGRWRTSLTDADAFIAQKICGTEMRRLGYSTTPLRPKLTDVAWRILTTPVSAWRMLSADQSWWRSKIPHVTKRIAAIIRG